MKRALFLLISFALAGCGGTVSPGSEQGNGGTGGTQGDCEPIPCPYPGWDPETCKCREMPGEDAQPGPDTGPEAAADAPQSKLVISIIDTNMYLNCMPEVPKDPLGGSFTVRYDNSQGADVSVVLTSAEWQLSGPWSFQVTPTEVGLIPAGSTLEVDHTKIANSAQGSGNPCGVCNGVGQLKVSWKLSDGQTVTE